MSDYTEIALVTLITESGDEVALEAYKEYDEAVKRVDELIELSGVTSFYIQNIQLR